MLVLDALCGLMTAALKEVCHNGRTDIALILGGRTSTLQPLNVLLNKPFKDRVQEQHNEWFACYNPKMPTDRLLR